MSTIGVKAIKFPDGDSAINITDGGNVTLAGTLNVNGAFTSQGIDDNADAIAIKIDASEKVSLGGSTAVTSDSKVAIHGGNLELTTAGARYWIPRASDGALTGSLYSPSGSVVRLSGAGTGSGTIEFEPRSSNGVIARVTGDGLCFGSDTAAANALDDYEEGTFSPVFQTGGNSNGISHSISSGTYTKVGNRVICNGFAAMNGKDGSNLTGGNVTIGGLPFAVSNDNNSYSAAGIRPQNISFADFMTLATVVGSTQLDFREITNSGSVTTLTDGNIASNSYIIFDISYRTG